MGICTHVKCRDVCTPCEISTLSTGADFAGVRTCEGYGSTVRSEAFVVSGSAKFFGEFIGVVRGLHGAMAICVMEWKPSGHIQQSGVVKAGS